MLIASYGITSLGAGIYAVKYLRAILKIETQGGEVVVPVGVLDNHLHVGIHLLCGLEDYILCRLVHQLKTILGPGPIAFGLDAEVALTVGEEEVVQYNLVKEACREFYDLLCEGTLFGVGVAEGFERVALVDGVGDAAGDLYALILEELDDLLHLVLFDDEQVAMGLQVDFIDLYLV